MSSSTAKRLAAEGLVIVVSVLVALSAEAWWSETQDRASARQHLTALDRDLTRMQASADSALAATVDGYQAGQLLLGSLGGGQPEILADSAITLVAQLHSFRVFSPSLGAYDALVASGQLEAVGSPELRRGLVDIYGSLAAVRAREEATSAAAQALTNSDPFLTMIGFDRMLPAFAGQVVGITPAEAEAWVQSRELQSHMGLLFGQVTVSLMEYQALSDRLAAARRQLSDELAG